MFRVTSLRFQCFFSGFEFRVSNLRIRVSGFGFQNLEFGFRVSGFRIRVSGFGRKPAVQRAAPPSWNHPPPVFSFSGLGSMIQVPGSGFGVPGFGFRVLGSEFRVPGSGFRVQRGILVSSSRFRGCGFRVKSSASSPLSATAACITVSSFELRVLCSGISVSIHGFQVSGFRFRV